MTHFIVHIGDGKCGSTSIQRSLFESRCELSALSIDYSTATPKYGHFSLITLLDGVTRGNNITQRKHAIRSIDLMREKVDSHEYILISSESLFGCDPERVYELLLSISDNIESVDIIAYVRPPAQMYLSLVQQQLKGDHKFTSAHRYMRPIDAILSRWAESSRVTSVTVRSFERDVLTGGDVVADFSNYLRTITSGKQVVLKNYFANQSLNAEQMIVLQKYRRSVCLESSGTFAKQSNLLLDVFDALDTLDTKGTKPVLRADVEKIVVENNAEIVQKINSMFPDLFLRNNIRVPVDKDGVFRSNVEITEDISSILVECNQEYVELLREVVGIFDEELSRDDVDVVGRTLRRWEHSKNIDLKL